MEHKRVTNTTVSMGKCHVKRVNKHTLNNDAVITNQNVPKTNQLKLRSIVLWCAKPSLQLVHVWIADWLLMTEQLFASTWIIETRKKNHLPFLKKCKRQPLTKCATKLPNAMLYAEIVMPLERTQANTTSCKGKRQKHRLMTDPHCLM